MDGVLWKTMATSLPSAHDSGPEIMRAMSVVAKAVREAVDLPLGTISCNDAIGASPSPRASGARSSASNQG